MAASSLYVSAIVAIPNLIDEIKRLAKTEDPRSEDRAAVAKRRLSLITQLAEKICTLTHWSRLDLNSLQLTDHELGILLTEIQKNPTILELILDHNEITHEGAEKIAFMLQTHPLTALSLCNNDLGNIGAGQLANGLLRNRYLRFLDLGFNNIDTHGAAALAESIAANPDNQLIFVGLSCNNITNPAMMAWAETLRGNTRFLDLETDGNTLKEEEITSTLSELTRILEDNQKAVKSLMHNNAETLKRLAAMQPDAIKALGIEQYTEQFQQANEAITQGIEQLKMTRVDKKVIVQWRQWLDKLTKQCEQNLEDVATQFLSMIASPLKPPVELDALALTQSMRDMQISFKISPHELTIESEELGRGVFGVVRRGEWRHIPVAVKELHPTENTTIKSLFVREMQIMAQLRSPNIVRLLGIGPTMIVMEYMSGGDLSQLLHKNSRPLSPRWIQNAILQIAYGLAFLHAEGIIHGDLKPTNVLLTASGEPKLTDFGLSVLEGNLDPSLDSHARGTPIWMAPELLAALRARVPSTITKEADMYSFALIIWEILTREVPYKQLATSIERLVQLVVDQEVRETIPKNTPANYVKVLTFCWDANPRKRLPVDTIIHEYLKPK